MIVVTQNNGIRNGPLVANNSLFYVTPILYHTNSKFTLDLYIHLGYNPIMEKKEMLILRIDPETKRMLAEIAKSQERSMSAQVRILIHQEWEWMHPEDETNPDHEKFLETLPASEA